MFKAPRKFVVPALVCLALALLWVVGCAPKAAPTSGASTTPRPTGPPIKIGAILSTSGAAGAPLGTAERDTALLVQDEINAAGGIHGRPVQVIVVDDQSDNTQAQTAAKQLIDQDKVAALIGPSLSGTTLAIAKTVNDAQVPMISLAASVKITQPVQKWVFSTAQPDTLAVARLYAYLQGKNLHKLGVLYDSNPFGKSGLDALQKAASGAGMQIVDAESFESKDTDMTTQLTKIKDKSPDAIVCWGTNPGPAIVAKNVKTLKITVPLFMSHGVSDQKFLDLAGPAADGVTFPAGRILVASLLQDTDKQKAALLAFDKSFQAKYHRAPDHFGGHAWDAMHLLAQVMATAGDDRAKICAGLEGVKDFVGISGVFNLSPTNHNGLTQDAFVMVTVQQGKWVLAQ